MSVVYLESVPSTQDELVRRLRAGESLNAVAAGEQTAGRGRFGRAWDSPPGESLSLSVALPAPEPMSAAPYVGMNLAVALAERYGVAVQWPNDVTSGGRKVAGILIEALKIEGRRLLVVGVGINLLQTSFPAALSLRATSILLATGRRYSPEEEAAAVASLAATDPPASWADLAGRWARVDETAGKRYRAPGGPVGVALGVAPDGRLLLQDTPNGAVRGSHSVAEAWFGPETSH